MIDKYVIDSIMFNQLIEEVTVANPPSLFCEHTFFSQNRGGTRQSLLLYE
jgi:hypothetical protein